MLRARQLSCRTPQCSRIEVLDILREYYAGLTEKVEIKLHRYAEGELDTDFNAILRRLEYAL